MNKYSDKEIMDRVLEIWDDGSSWNRPVEAPSEDLRDEEEI